VDRRATGSNRRAGGSNRIKPDRNRIEMFPGSPTTGYRFVPPKGGFIVIVPLSDTGDSIPDPNPQTEPGCLLPDSEPLLPEPEGVRFGA
jgi:hypothetical protein